MSKVIKIKRGLDIKLKGTAEKILVKPDLSGTFALKPTDIHGLTPKLAVQVDSDVKAGDPLFFDKYRPEVLFTSPVSGTVLAVNRGERRRILEVVVKPDTEIRYKEFTKANPATLSREQIVTQILEAGAWPFIRQRPYNVVANPTETPKAIFISAFDSAPLAPDYDFLVKGEKEAFQAGVDALKKLTAGSVHLSTHADYPPSEVFAGVKGAEIHTVKGPHPAGNIGVQIHHIDPINKGEVVWFVNPLDVIIIGRLFLKGIFDASKSIALTGSEVKNPRYYKTLMGAGVSEMLGENLKADNKNRIISGNVLSGSKISTNGYLGYYDNQITVIPEGDYYDFLGWATLGLKKFSVSRSFLSWLTPKKAYALDTNYHGGERAFVMTGQYENVVPMDILPVQLLKAILAEDIDKMEQLGIYEVAPEDFALCEFVCTSKIDVQDIVSKGIDMMIKEMA